MSGTLLAASRRRKTLRRCGKGDRDPLQFAAAAAEITPATAVHVALPGEQMRIPGPPTSAADATRMVTLVWNPDDIAEVFRSQFGPGPAHQQMSIPNHFMCKVGDPQHLQSLWADQVLVGGEDIGTSSGRCFSQHSREMLSLATVQTAYAEEGTEVVVLWGDPGTVQKEIRATVARFPYLVDPVRNERFDVPPVPPVPPRSPGLWSTPSARSASSWSSSRRTVCALRDRIAWLEGGPAAEQLRL